jgi:hypothetical protein
MTKITLNPQDIFRQAVTKNPKRKQLRLPPMQMTSYTLNYLPNTSTGFRGWLLIRDNKWNSNTMWVILLHT